jgi:hypothetical protein
VLSKLIRVINTPEKSKICFPGLKSLDIQHSEDLGTFIWRERNNGGFVVNCRVTGKEYGYVRERMLPFKRQGRPVLVVGLHYFKPRIHDGPQGRAFSYVVDEHPSEQWMRDVWGQAICWSYPCPLFRTRFGLNKAKLTLHGQQLALKLVSLLTRRDCLKVGGGSEALVLLRLKNSGLGLIYSRLSQFSGVAPPSITS